MNSMGKYFILLTIEKSDSVLRKICKRREKVKDMSIRQKPNEHVIWKHLFKHVYLNSNKSTNKK